MPVEPSRYTPAADVRARGGPGRARGGPGRARDPGMADLADQHGPHATRRAIVDKECARGAVDADREHALDRAIGRLELDATPGRDLADGPLVDVEAPVAQRVDVRFEPVDEGAQQRVVIDRPTAGRLAQRRHRRCEFGREVGSRPVRVDPESDDDPRIDRAEALGLAEHPGQLADLRGRRPERRKGYVDRLDDEVVRPLQADGAFGQVGLRLCRARHRERHGGGQPPDAVRRQPVRTETE